MVLPEVERLPAVTLRRLAEFVPGGGILRAARRLPVVVPGWLNRESETRAIAALVRGLFERPSARAHSVRQEEAALGQTLGRLRRPDVILERPPIRSALRIAARPSKALPLGGARAYRGWLEAPVREPTAAVVNGRRAGSLRRPPCELDITGLLRAGENRLEIVVPNLMINRMASEPVPDYTDRKASQIGRFPPQDLENLRRLPSRLLVPVRLVPY